MDEVQLAQTSKTPGSILATLSPERFQECEQQPQLFLVEMERWPEGSTEWCTLAGLFVCACATRLEQLEFALYLAEILNRKYPSERHKVILSLAESRLSESRRGKV